MSGKVDFNEFIALFQTLAVYLQGRDVNRLVANHEIAQEPPMEEQLDMGLPVECLPESGLTLSSDGFLSN